VDATRVRKLRAAQKKEEKVKVVFVKESEMKNRMPLLYAKNLVFFAREGHLVFDEMVGQANVPANLTENTAIWQNLGEDYWWQPGLVLGPEEDGQRILVIVTLTDEQLINYVNLCAAKMAECGDDEEDEDEGDEVDEGDEGDENE
jgi:hypothetical protein